MKTVKRLLFFIAGICLMISCSESDETLMVDDPLGSNLKSDKSGSVTVTVPFKADFSVWNKSDGTKCEREADYFLTMEGSGNITHLGRMTTSMTFCAEATNLPQRYYGTVGSFVAANGDELLFVIPDGLIVVNDEDNSDYYQAKFNDPISFVGGTGRFEGASGEAMTNAYVHAFPQDEWRTDFFSEGTLILVKGKR